MPQRALGRGVEVLPLICRDDLCRNKIFSVTEVPFSCELRLGSC